MGWRTVVVENSASLRCDHQQLMIRQGELDFQVPLEDIDTLLIDSPQVTVSAPVLRALSQHGGILIVCDEKHLPCGVYLSQNQHYRGGSVVELQLAASRPLVKRLWQRLVIAKITKQALILPQVKQRTIARLEALRSKVRSGDPSNIEAQAAKVYWRSLFGEQFRRGDDDTTNAGLNYGYTIVRSALARAVTDRGLLPILGLFHRNVNNPFCLVDDLIEPFRPLVDRVVRDHIHRSATFERDHRAKLIALLHDQVDLGGESLTLSAAANEVASSLVRSFQSRKPELLLLPSPRSLPGDPL